MTHKITLTLIASSLLITACASKPDRRGPPGGGDRGQSYQGMAVKPIALLFTSMDENQDTVIQAEEFLSGINQEWDRLSAGGTGAINYSAWAVTALGSEDALPNFISFDRDLSGTLTKTEFDDRLRTAFSGYDKNNDGALQRSELVFRVSPPRQERSQQGGQRGSRDDGGGGGRGNRPPR